MHEQVTANKRRAAVLLVGFAVAVAAVASLLALLSGSGAAGVGIAVVIGALAAFGAHRSADAVVLRLSRARPSDPDEHARLHNLVEGLCVASGLPKPQLYVVDDPAPNALATGRDPRHASIAVTTGLLEKLNRVELEGVLAHELAHIKNHDTGVGALAVTTLGGIVVLADLGARARWWGGGRRRYAEHDGHDAGAGVLLVPATALLVLSPLVARLRSACTGPRRAALADLGGVEVTRYPPGLLSALEKLRDDSTIVASHSRATSHLWIAEAAPLDDEEGAVPFLNRANGRFATHPPLEERIAALREL